MWIAWMTVAPAASPLDDVVSLDAGQNTCALRRDGSVWCWGNGHHGAQHQGSPPYARPVLGLRDVVQIEAGEQGWCVRHGDATVSCWGLGATASGEVDHGIRTVPGVMGATDVTVGSTHGCVLDEGTVRCWRFDRSQREGDGAHEETHPLRPVALPTRAVEVDAGARHTCAVLEDGSLWCWGVGGAPSPWPLPNADRPLRQLESGNGITCGIGPDGRARCFELDGSVRNTPHDPLLGDRPVHAHSLANTAEVRPLPPMSGCVIRRESDQGVHCFEQRRPRTRSGPPQWAWTEVPLTEATHVASGHRHACARLEDSTVWCWGSPLGNRLGGGASPELQVVLEEKVTDVAAFAIHPSTDAWCAVTRGPDPGLRCEGVELVDMDALSEATSIAFAGNGVCGTVRGGRVRCVTGDGYGADLAAVGDLVVRRELKGSPSLVCGIDGRNTLRCEGRLDVFFNSAAPPILEIADTQTYFVQSGGRGCALREDGEVLCFGGEYGAGPASWRVTYGDPRLFGHPMQLLVAGNAPWTRLDGVIGAPDWLCGRAGPLAACGFHPWRGGTTPRLLALAGPVPTGQWAVGPGVACVVSDGELHCLSHAVRLFRDWTAPSRLLKVVGVDNVVEVQLREEAAFGTARGCVLRADRTLACWTEPWTPVGGDPHPPVQVRRQP